MLSTTQKNVLRPLTLIGQGFTNCIVPPFLHNHFFKNAHIYSPYTPYQPEISQGRLELQYLYQRMIQDITQKPFSVASLIDCGQIAMDILLIMKKNAKRTMENHTVLIPRTFNIHIYNCMKTRADQHNIYIKYYDAKMLQSVIYEEPNIIGVFFQSPDSIGELLDPNIIKNFEKHNIMSALNSDLLYMSTNPLLQLHEFDFVFGNGTNLGIGLNYGGPQPAFLSSKKEHLRKLPGRIVTTATDKLDQLSYRMALQTREQHIRRERATSNVCTSQSLLANLSCAWTLFHGNEGLHNITEHIQHLTTLARAVINKYPEFRILNSTHFDTITFSSQIIDINDSLNKHNILGYVHSKTPEKTIISLTFDQTHTIDDIIYLEITLGNILHHKSSVIYDTNINSKNLIHTTLKDDIFQKYNQNEQELMRYLYKLGNKDYSLMNGIIPLGSCTMKHTPYDSMNNLANDEFNVHPYNPEITDHYKTIISNLNKHLLEYTRFPTVFYQSQSGRISHSRAGRYPRTGGDLRGGGG